MPTRFDTLPTSLKQRARLVNLAGVPSLVVHPDWETPAPLVLWMHGRTADKELDPGRYQRWMRAGIAACAIDLPGHGQRAASPATTRHAPAHSLNVLAQALTEIDPVLAALQQLHTALIDPTRLGIGGMSLGGMVALRRLCDPHPFVCAAVESTTGWLAELYRPSLPDPPGRVASTPHPEARIAPLDPMAHLAGFRPIPLLALHSEADQIVPWAGQRAFLDRLAAHYSASGADPALIEARTWPTTGAPYEHSGFGKVASHAKDAQTAFFKPAFGVG